MIHKLDYPLARHFPLQLKGKLRQICFRPEFCTRSRGKVSKRFPDDPLFAS